MLLTEVPTRVRFGVTAETNMVQADNVPEDLDALREQADYVFLLDEFAATNFDADYDCMIMILMPGGIVIW
jgi:hypothetical protein